MNDIGQLVGAIILLVGLFLLVGWVLAGKSEEERPRDRNDKPPGP